MVKSKFYNLDTDTNLGGEESSDLYVASEKAVKAYVDAHAHAADNKSITENSLNQLQTVGVIDSNDSTKAIKTWTGTKEAYNGFFDLVWNGPIEDSELADYGEGGLAYNGTKFVYLYGSGYLSTSTNGTTWAEPTYIDNLGLGDDTWYGLASDGTKFVALSGDGYTSTSTDGTTWTECTIDSNMGSHGWYGLASDGTKFVALGQPGYISTTTDGINWSVSTQDTNLANGDWRFLTYGNGKFVALSFYNYISTSTDGITWTTPVQISNFGNKDCNCLAYDGYKFVAINKSGEVSTSIDGITWTVPVVVPNFGQDNYSGALCYDGTKLVAILYNGIFTCLVTGSLDNNTLYNIIEDGLYLGPNKIADNANDAILTITQNGTTKGTFSANASNNTTIALTDTTYSTFTGANGSVAGTIGLVPAPTASDNTKFLKGDGTWATVSSGTTYTAGTGIDITSGVISVTTPTLTNIATGSNSLTVGGINFNGSSSVNVGISSKASNGSTAVGYNAQAMAQASITIGQSANVASTASNSIAIGANTSCTGNTSIAIGINASTTATRAIQLGYGTNSEANSFYVSTSTSNNWKMLGSDGFIPDARLSSNIARTSAIPTVDQTYSASSTNAQSGTAVAQALASNYAMVITDYTAA